MLSYVNKKGKEVKLLATRHSYNRFIDRYNMLHPENKIEPKQVVNYFNNTFSNTQRIKNTNKQEKLRLKKHGKDTMFFRTSGFTFIVENAMIVTVEISDRNKRFMNKIA